MSGKSDFLFAQPTIWEGMGRLLDFGDFLTEYNYSLTPELADNIATTMDWQAVCDDLWAAFEQFRESLDPEVQAELAAAGFGD